MDEANIGPHPLLKTFFRMHVTTNEAKRPVYDALPVLHQAPVD